MTHLRPGLHTVRQAASAFGAAPGALWPVNAGVNTVYRVGDLALRLCSAQFRNRAALTPPLDWLRWLHAHGASVCEPLSTPDGRWTVEVSEEETEQEAAGLFLATATRWVNGPRLSDVPPTPEVYREYGRSIGRLHRAARGFQPAPGTPHLLQAGEPGVFPRWDWLWLRAARHAGGHPVLERAFGRLTPSVLAWSTEEHIVTHGDLRPGNVIWRDGSAVVIDFDEPVAGPAALDLARAGLELSAQERPVLLPALLSGYRLEHPLAPVWDGRLPDLMAARAALMAAWSVEDGHLTPGSGSGRAVSVPTLLGRLERGEF